MSDDKTLVISRPSGGSGGGYASPQPQQPEIWFEVENMPDKRILLPEGVAVTVGRDEQQDLSIADKTMSRQHLVLTRRASVVSIDVKGLNGLTLNGVLYKHQILEVGAPETFTLGNLNCQLTQMEEVDEDATVLVAPAMTSGAEFSQSPSAFSGGVQTPSKDAAFQAPHSDPIPSQAPGEAPVGSPQGMGVPQPSSSYQDPIPQQGPSLADQYAPPPDLAPPVFAKKTSSKDHGSRRKMMIAASVVVGILIISGGVGYWFFNRPDSVVPPVAQTVPASVSEDIAKTSTSQPSPRGKARINDLHGRLIQEARDNIAKGRYSDACDCLRSLSNIPKENPYYGQAHQLAKEIQGCDL